MAGLPWYRQWTEFSRHDKTRDLAARVKDRNAGMYLVRIQEHCAEHALDGRIRAAIVEDVAEWRGRTGVLLAALEATGSLEVEGEIRVLHGWVERNGAVIRKWLDDNGKPHGKRRKPRTNPGPNPVETPYGVGSGFRRVDVDLERSGSKPPVVPQAEQLDRWAPILAAMTPAQQVELDRQKTAARAEVERLLVQPDCTSPPRVLFAELEERLFEEWSNRVERPRLVAGGA